MPNREQNGNKLDTNANLRKCDGSSVTKVPSTYIVEASGVSVCAEQLFVSFSAITVAHFL